MSLYDSHLSLVLVLSLSLMLSASVSMDSSPLDTMHYNDLLQLVNNDKIIALQQTIHLEKSNMAPIGP